ncbi:YcxB family protein [Sutcliffiella horikoshii]|uniref:YcxB family protein n=1 Tax=Sutcliffiella horikoshii TaxID=79883 RepID=A0AA94WQ06_9BACI|nr:YcxB family protein [Sutcliffiella horikoshii]TYS58523.1 YcxB family protein [Sutcliffiella horikoshii]
MKRESLPENDTLVLRGTLTEKEFVKYGYYHFKKLHMILFYFLLFFTFLVFAVPTTKAVEADLYIYFYLLYAIISLVVSLPALLLGKFAVKVKASSEYKSDQLIKNEMTYTFNANEIQQKFDRSIGYYDWNQIQAAYESKDMFRLYVSRAKAIILPKRFFSSEVEIQLLKSLIKENLSKEKVKF